MVRCALPSPFCVIWLAWNPSEFRDYPIVRQEGQRYGPRRQIVPHLLGATHVEVAEEDQDKRPD